MMGCGLRGGGVGGVGGQSRHHKNTNQNKVNPTVVFWAYMECSRDSTDYKC